MVNIVDVPRKGKINILFTLFHRNLKIYEKKPLTGTAITLAEIAKVFICNNYKFR